MGNSTTYLLTKYKTYLAGTSLSTDYSDKTSTSLLRDLMQSYSAANWLPISGTTPCHHTLSLLFSEYCELKQIDKQGRSPQAIALRRAAFDDYIRQGGFPELQFLRYDRDYVDTLVDNILKRDIEQRFRLLIKPVSSTLPNT